MNVEVVFWIVVLVRFFLPLLIFKFPLPAIFACLVVDGMDQTIFQWFDFNPPFYQSYDKAMDVFYLGIAYISTLRNWASIQSFEVSRFLFFYRQIGVVAFEVTQVRALLLVFPNTFEYFFIAYEGIRARWNPVRFGMRFWIIVAGFIWIFIKLPQEYWIHVAQLDFTDTVKDVSWFGPAVVTGILVLLALFWFVVRPRLIAADHPLQWRAPALPPEVDEAWERTAFMAEHGKVWSVATLEKVLLIGLLSAIFGFVIPDLRISNIMLFTWIATFIVINSAISLGFAQRGRSTKSIFVAFAVRVTINATLMVAINAFVYGELNLQAALFFLLLLSVLVTLYDRYRPIYEYRVQQAQSQALAR